jgi:hypothetical protein
MKELSSFGQLLGATIKIYKEKWWEFVELALLALVGAFPLVIVYVVYYLVNYSNYLGQYQGANTLLAILYFAATLLAAYFALSAIIGSCLVANDDKKMSAWQIILSTRHYFWHFLLVWLMLEALLISCGLPLVLVFKLASGNWPTLLFGSGTAFGFWLAAATAVFAMPLIWAMINYGLSFFALMEGGLQNVSALRRSRELVKGNFWSLLLRFASFAACVLALYLLATLHLWWPSTNTVYAVWSMLMKIVLIFSNFVFLPCLIIFGRLLYKELVAMKPRTKLSSAGSPLLVKIAVALGLIFLIFALSNTINVMSSKSLMLGKMAQRDAQRLQDIRSMQAALASYYQEQGAYPEWLVMGQPLEAGGKVYLESLPSNVKVADGDCPVDYEYGYYQVASGQDYVLTYCLGVGLGDADQILLTAGEHKVGQDDLIFN